MVINEKPYRNGIPLSGNALLVTGHLAKNGKQHFAKISRETGIPAYTVAYQCYRLKVRGLVELERIGTLTFVSLKKWEDQ